MYPSRSELFRVALKEFLVHELEAAKAFATYKETRVVKNSPPEIDNSLFVRVPVSDNPIEGVTEFTTYKLGRKKV